MKKESATRQKTQASGYVCRIEAAETGKSKIFGEKIKALRHPNRELNNTHRQKWAEAVRGHKIGVATLISVMN